MDVCRSEQETTADLEIKFKTCEATHLWNPVILLQIELPLTLLKSISGCCIVWKVLVFPGFILWTVHQNMQFFHMRNSKMSNTRIWLFLALTGRYATMFPTVDGSSRNTTCLPPSNARAADSFLIFPPEYVSAGRFAYTVSPISEIRCSISARRKAWGIPIRRPYSHKCERALIPGMSESN
jgi:hypothetical protein